MVQTTSTTRKPSSAPSYSNPADIHDVEALTAEGEHVIAQVGYHWMISKYAILWSTIMCLGFVHYWHDFKPVIIIGIIITVGMWFDSLGRLYACGFVLTDRRIIMRTDFLRPKLEQIFLKDINEFEREQSRTGRNMDYGNLILKGDSNIKDYMDYIQDYGLFIGKLQSLGLKETIVETKKKRKKAKAKDSK